MLSILIPVYQYHICPLVTDLVAQGRALGQPFEVLLFDDGSDLHFRLLNREVQRHPEVDYRELPHNLGRSAIRNALAQAAHYPYLLFMDCDSQTVTPHYLANYVQRLAPRQVLYGGRCYHPAPPPDPALNLHWHYGRQREQTTAAQRMRQPYASFMTNNFVLPRADFLAIGFDERVRYYGHEDTLFGLALAHKGIPIVHLDNPLTHLGLEPAPVFLRKQQQAVANLSLLKNQLPVHATRLGRWAHNLRRWGLAPLVGGLLGWLAPRLQQHLCQASQPRLVALDLLKLWWALHDQPHAVFTE